MIRFIDSKKMGRGIHSWLDSHFHFSFADYCNPQNIQFGILRVVNDDLVQPNTGFDTHPHENMEIISYVIDGELTHADSMENKRTLTRGQVQYMSAGTGVTHSEYNLGSNLLRFLQIWILPDKKGYKPIYGDYPFNWSDRENKWLPIATGSDNQETPIHIHADINVYAAEIAQGNNLEFEVNTGRQAYLVLIEGAAEIGEHSLSMRDALEITEESVVIKANETAHVLALEMGKSL